MEQAILTDAQKKVVEAVADEPHLADFYLTGGTALAVYYFHHRISDDLDFFAAEEADKIFLRSFAKKLKQSLKARDVRFERLYDRNLFFFAVDSGELKVEFSKYPFPRLGAFSVKGGIKIDSLRDIAANKLMALLDRFDPKDFVDLFFILQKFDLEKVRRDAEKKFGVKIDDIFLGGELAKVRRVEALPKMTKPLTVEKLKDFFSKKAKELGKKIIL